MIEHSLPTPAIRAAGCADAADIVALLAQPATVGLLLPRSQAEVLEAIGSFAVAVDGERVIGCVAIRDYGSNLFEIRSLVVIPEFMGHGLGSRLVDTACAMARERSGENLFTLTYRPHIFERLGFSRVSKEMFPQKVWLDCAKCKKRDCCDEIALLKRT